MARDYLQQLRHQQGKFRSFLLAYLKNFLSEREFGRYQVGSIGFQGSTNHWAFHALGQKREKQTDENDKGGISEGGTRA